VTLNQRLSPSQLDQATEQLRAVTSLDGGINLQTPERGKSHFTTGLILPGPESPTRAANICIRRSNYGSILLQSPARAGYATRMRQMFEDAGHHRHEEQDNVAMLLYPQLPNISRKAAPSPVRSPNRSGAAHQAITHASSTYRPESLCLSNKPSLAVSLAGAPPASLLCPSERSSGSWSDDSGYIVTTRSRRCSLTVAPDERIRTWLLELRDHKMENAQEGTDEGLHPASNAYSCQDTDVSVPDEALTGNDGEPALFTKDPFVYDGDAPSLTELHEKRVATAFFERRPIRDISDVCKPLKLDYLNQTYTTPPRQVVGTSAESHRVSAEAKKRVNGSELLEEGGVQLSPLSPNVCVERGPSRYHSPRRPLQISHVATPSKNGPDQGFQAPQWKENVVLRHKECTGSGGVPLAPRGNGLGTRFRQPQ
jgi:hypothetical protein